jgi:hypothetical protein
MVMERIDLIQAVVPTNVAQEIVPVEGAFVHAYPESGFIAEKVEERKEGGFGRRERLVKVDKPEPILMTIRSIIEDEVILADPNHPETMVWRSSLEAFKNGIDDTGIMRFSPVSTQPKGRHRYLVD